MLVVLTKFAETAAEREHEGALGWMDSGTCEIWNATDLGCERTRGPASNGGASEL